MRYSEIHDRLSQYVYDEDYSLTNDEMAEISKRYGNVPVGTVYWGTAINSQSFLDWCHSVENGGTLSVSCISTSPDRDTALSYAEYRRSYDGLHAMGEFVQALKRGSSGQYGSAVITLRPDAHSVVAKMYAEGNERKDWELFPAPEREAILSGEIPVVGIQIYEVLTKDNFKTELVKLGKETLVSSFAKKWLDYWKIPLTDRCAILKEIVTGWSLVDRAKILDMNAFVGEEAVLTTLLPDLPLTVRENFIGVDISGLSFSIPVSHAITLLPRKTVIALTNNPKNDLSFLSALLRADTSLIKTCSSPMLKKSKLILMELVDGFTTATINEPMSDEDFYQLKDLLSWVVTPQERKGLLSRIAHHYLNGYIPKGTDRSLLKKGSDDVKNILSLIR